jgi:O-methyltransferase domain
MARWILRHWQRLPGCTDRRCTASCARWPASGSSPRARTDASASRRRRNRCGPTPPIRSATTSCWWARYSGPSEHLLHSVQTGRPAFERVHGADFFTFLAREPAAAAIFDAAMTSRSVQENDAIATVCDFSSLQTIIDVGGGYGSLLAAILRVNPRLRGVLLDRPQPVAEARRQLEAAGLGVRCEVVERDFFVSVPAGGDAYILKRVIHDWDDERARAILRNCHRAMPDHGRLLVIELVLPPGNDPSLGKLFDLLMLVDLGGRERTEADFRTLFAGAGFELTGVIPTPSLVSVVQAMRR